MFPFLKKKAWLANCVGWRNHKYFMLFMFYVVMGCLYTCVTTLPIFLFAIDPKDEIWNFATSISVVVYSWILALCVTLAVGGLFGWQIYLVCTAQTTVEFHLNVRMKMRAKSKGMHFENPYDFGVRANLLNFFGSPGFLYYRWWTISFDTPPGDGIKWKEKKFEEGLPL